MIEELPHDRLEALYRVSSVLGSSLNLDEVLDEVMEAVVRLTGAERGFLMLLDSMTSNWQVRAVRNYNLESLASKDLEISRSVIASVRENGKGLVTTDARSDPRFANQESVVLHSLRSIMCAPLLFRGQVFGVIYVDHRAQSGLFVKNDLRLLEMFAAQAAIAIQNANLHRRTDQELARRVSELETLTQVDRDLNASLELERVLEITKRWAIQGTGAKDGVLFLVGEDAPTGTSASLAGGFVVRLQHPLVVKAMESGSAQVELPSSVTPAMIVVPISHVDSTLGVLVVSRPDLFDQDAAIFLERLAIRAAATIANAQLYRAVQRANQAKTKFISVVTHELRTPMTSIKGYTDLLRAGVAGALSEQQLNFLNVIRNNVERMSALVSDLSDISRIETGRLRLECAFLSLQTSVDESLHALRSNLEEKRQTLEVNIPANLLRVYADPNRLVQVLNNLLSNAWKFTPEGGRVTVTANEEDGFVRVVVTDNGIGISPEDQEQIFSQFFRSEDQRVRDQQGWGLGLNVTRRLVELMGGSIEFESEPEVGSSFWFTLPTQRPNTPA